MREDAMHQLLFELARRDKTDLAATMRCVTEGSAGALDVTRVGIWSLEPDRSTICCRDLFLRTENRHLAGERLASAGHERYFAALLESRAIVANDARADPRTRELSASYLEPLGITSMMDVPIWHRGKLYGVLCHEHTGPARRWDRDEIVFASNLADILATSLESCERNAAERRWKAALGVIPEGVCLMRANGELELMNPAMENFLSRIGGGRSLEDRRVALEYVDAADRPLPPDRWPSARALRGETVRGEIIGATVRATGERKYLRVTATALTDEPAEDEHVLVVGDVTEEVLFERLKRDFLAAVAHELKTPVAVAKAYAQLLARTGARPERELSMLAAIVRSADRMDALIQNLVDVSSIILGKLALTRERTDLSALAHDVTQLIAQSATRHRFVIVAPEPVEVVVDAARIRQAIRHLIDNAVRYSAEGTTIEVTIARVDREVRLSVRDEGVGVPADCKSRMFEPFFRAHGGTLEDKGGLGIGLFLSREIVERNGGTLSYESKEGRGSTFIARFPVAESS